MAGEETPHTAAPYLNPDVNRQTQPHPRGWPGKSDAASRNLSLLIYKMG